MVLVGRSGRRGWLGVGGSGGSWEGVLGGLGRGTDVRYPFFKAILGVCMLNFLATVQSTHVCVLVCMHTYIGRPMCTCMRVCVCVCEGNMNMCGPFVLFLWRSPKGAGPPLASSKFQVAT